MPRASLDPRRNDRGKRSAFFVALAATSLFGGSASAQTTSAVASAPPGFQVETIARGLQNPWGLAFLPDGRMLVTERIGRLRIVNPRAGSASGPIAGVPEVVARGQGGLLGLATDPGFGSNRLIYFCYSEARENGSGTSVARARLSTNGTTLEEVSVLFRQSPAGTTTRHFGCRLVFDRSGHLFVTLGDRGNLQDQAQSLEGTIGKIVRIRTDGAAPSDNPFAGRADSRPEIWSYGHRNIQGAALHPETGQLWTVEHGARGGDEVNRPSAGRNYGWPVITFGRDYSGAKIGVGTQKEGLEQPVYYWDPSIAPSGAAFYTGARFPAWRGSLFVGALAGQHLSRLSIAGDRVTGEEKLLTDLGERIRDVVQGPDGLLYLLTDSADGRVLRLTPR